MEVIRVGRRAALVEVGSAVDALSLALWARGRIAATDVVPAARTVLLDGVEDPDRVGELLEDWRPGPVPGTGPVVEVPVAYDGPDLAEVARAWDVPVDQVATRHAAVEHVSAFCGFAPGFAYLANDAGLPGVPRKRTPRSRVEPGSVALAGPFTGIYPTASPGGWQVVGRTRVTLWDPERTEPALLAPGVRVRFVPT
jgi:KipI family sensor histidine kinase inhibitor